MNRYVDQWNKHVENHTEQSKKNLKKEGKVCPKCNGQRDFLKFGPGDKFELIPCPDCQATGIVQGGQENANS